MFSIKISIKKIVFVSGCLLLGIGLFAQTVNLKLQKAFQQFENDTQLKFAISSLYVIGAKTGKVVFDKNSSIGLAPASTQKIITSATAFELLGSNYRYKTFFYLDGKINKDTLFGNLIIKGTGDPTFGSPRFQGTDRATILEAIGKMLNAKHINFIDGNVVIDETNFESNTTPDGWIWQDIGNYYGAGAGALNWNENQYDLILKPGLKENDDVKIIRTEPDLQSFSLVNELTTGSKGSGDNAYIYLVPYSTNGFVRGTIPPGFKEFPISGSIPVPSSQFLYELQKKLDELNIKVNGKFTNSLEYKSSKQAFKYDETPFNFLISPSLDSMVYWFLKKSINLYGEALLKTIAYEQNGFGSTDSGVDIVKDFWRQKGIDAHELNISDGSGLSPQNRVTTHAQVEVLKYAKTKVWFPYFYDALPEYNNMKMKSGTIRDVKGFCGYQKAKNGKEYIFSFLVNNYNGSTSLLVNKMFKILDNLK
ncbi:MAG: D-alanyl-D-alanine carboxypeptidase/D-alanyl-D-alanine-endopeptidase [Bacteroidia bacterium]|nr:D-alanyl-D-alanine carboxypeptidase/D-alanyl-D-alanine-endopeptidase [Bacteroidia bacterium]